MNLVLRETVRQYAIDRCAAENRKQITGIGEGDGEPVVKAKPWGSLLDLDLSSARQWATDLVSRSEKRSVMR
jgi:hypothetical protein